MSFTNANEEYNLKNIHHYEILSEAFAADIKMFNKDLILLDDKSIFVDLYEFLLKKEGINYTKICCSDLEIQIKENKFKDKILFLPLFEFRIFNINFDRRTDTHLGAPYLVHICNNQNEQIRKYFRQFFYEVIANPLAEFPHFLISYLRSKDLIDWLESSASNVPHNDKFDKNFMQRALGTEDKDAYKKSNELQNKSLATWLYDKFCDSEDIFYHHYPIHQFYKKYLNLKLKVNIIEQEIYGNVY